MQYQAGVACVSEENWNWGQSFPSFDKMATTLENANPTIFQQKKERDILPEEEDEEVVDKIDEREVFDILY